MDLAAEIESCGRVWLRGAISGEALQTLARESDVGARPGARIDANAPLLDVLGTCGPLSSALRALGVDPTPVRFVAFSKDESANWSVPWHQDRCVAVKARKLIRGYRNWAPKDGFWHCEPPFALLEKMVFVRVHFDPCGALDGALELALSSHHSGVVAASEAGRRAAGGASEICAAEPGDVLIVKALTLHRSLSSKSGRLRRALRIDYAPRQLLDPRLEWAIAPQTVQDREVSSR